MGKTDLEIHTKEYIHIKKRTLVVFIWWFLAFGVIYGFDVMAVHIPENTLNVGLLLGSQVMAILVVLLAYVSTCYDSEGKYYWLR